jgi:hypothetical protein
MSRIFRPGQANSSSDPAARLVRLGASHYAKRDLAGRQGGNPGLRA